MFLGIGARSPQQLKKESRLEFKKRLALISDKDQKSFSILENLRFFLSSKLGAQSPLRCAVFSPIENEPAIQDLYLRPDIQPELNTVYWAFPKVEDERLSFFYEPNNHILPDYFSSGPFQILEPDLRYFKEISGADIDVFLVPGLAFDRQMNRLGRGKGYYDKALQNYQGLRVGVFFSEQMSESHLTTEDHDIQLDWVVTESSIFKKVEQKRKVS